MSSGSVTLQLEDPTGHYGGFGQPLQSRRGARECAYTVHLDQCAYTVHLDQCAYTAHLEEPRGAWPRAPPRGRRGRAPRPRVPRSTSSAVEVALARHAECEARPCPRPTGEQRSSVNCLRQFGQPLLPSRSLFVMSSTLEEPVRDAFYTRGASRSLFVMPSYSRGATRSLPRVATTRRGRTRTRARRRSAPP